MDKGVIAEQGSPEQIFENPKEERTKNSSNASWVKILTTRLTGGLIKGYKPIIPASA